MTTRLFRVILQHLDRTVQSGTADGWTDAQLLERFTNQQDPTAFEILVHRHGPMVLGICRRVLGDEHEAEDAFQATLLVLLRKAASIRNKASIGSWLYGVAYRTAVKARALALRRSWHESRIPQRKPMDSLAEMVWQDLRPVLDEELNRLPEKYRSPVVLCYVQGKTHVEAAEQLHWPVGTVKVRLARARQVLQTRLARRGCTLAAAALTTVLEQCAASAALPARLAASTTKMATLWLTGEGVLAANISGKVVTLLEETLRTMFLAKVKLVAAALLIVTVAAAGTSWVAHRPALAAPGDESAQQPAPLTAQDPASGQAEGQQAARRDRYGDPLPPGAVARLGSQSLRHLEVLDQVFSADGRTLISAGGDGVVRYWEVATGRLARAVRMHGKIKCDGPGVLSLDGKVFVNAAQGKLVFWDTESGDQLQRLPMPRPDYWCPWMHFSPDGQTLAMDIGFYEVALWNWKEGTHHRISLPIDGNRAGRDVSRHACFSPDGKLLATGPSYADPLCIWDVATGRELCRLDAQASVSAFSPDNKFLAAVNRPGRPNQENSVLRFYEVATGKEVRQVPLSGKRFYQWIGFSRDEKVIALVSTLGIAFLDGRTGRELHWRSELGRGGWHTASLSPDGRILAEREVNRIHLWNAATGQELQPRPGKGCAVSHAAYTPDGRFLATCTQRSDITLDLWETTTGRHVRLLDTEEVDESRSLSIATDRQTLFVLRGEGTIGYLDLATGKRRRTLSFNDAGQPKKHVPEFVHLSSDGKRAITLQQLFAPTPPKPARVCIWETSPVKLIASQAFPTPSDLGWAPLGEQVALLTDEGIVVAEAGTGLFHRRVPGAYSAPLAASSKEMLLAAKDGGQQPAAVRVWEVVTGKEVATLPTGPIDYLALTPDGRTLVTTDGAALRLWDVATGKERHLQPFPGSIAGSPGFVLGLYLSPNGCEATTALADGTLLVWALPARFPPMKPPREALDTDQMARLWTDLAGEDAAKATAAMWKLADAPKSAVALLRRHLKPATEENPQRVRQLLQDLDKDSFALREGAAKELENMGAAVTPALGQALAANPSLELRRRLERLLDQIARHIPSGERLGQVRALRVLEQIASPEARWLLEVMAGGASAAQETQEAKACLRRLNP